jgi:hypothetical protein
VPVRRNVGGNGVCVRDGPLKRAPRQIAVTVRRLRTARLRPFSRPKHCAAYRRWRGYC